MASNRLKFPEYTSLHTGYTRSRIFVLLISLCSPVWRRTDSAMHARALPASHANRE